MATGETVATGPVGGKLRRSLRRLAWIAAMVAAIGLAGSATAVAGLKPVEPAPATGQVTNPFEAAEGYREWIAEHATGMIEPLVDYPALDLGQPPCVAGARPRVRAILVGASNPGKPFITLTGPDNDLALLRASLKARDVADEDIVALSGAEANRGRLAAAFADTVRRTACRDRVILYFGGHSARPADLLHYVLPKDLRARFEKFPIEELVATNYSEPGADFLALRVAHGAGLLLALNGRRADAYELVAASDVSEFMTAIRNRQAEITVALDTSRASSADLAARQQRAGDTSLWSLDTAQDPQATEQDQARPPGRLLPNHGGFSVFYSSVGDSESIELAFDGADGGKTTYGVFTFRLANVIQNRDSVTVRALAESLKALPAEPIKQNAATYSQRYRIDASDPEMLLFTDASLRPPSDAITITRPTPKRGAVAIERPEVEIEGRVDWSSPARAVLVDGKTATIRADGSFAYTAKLKPGLNAIEIVALTADARTHEKRLEFVFEGDRKALEGEGRRYAVIIANQNYDRAVSGFDPLKTPFADADAVQRLLEEKYGFVTRAAMPGGRELSLVLKDATRHDIENMLYKIGLVAGEKDTVLIYYAGHGIYEERTTIAFWVPSDAEAGVPISYLSASTIAEAVQRMQAGKVIIISDSCFSGALLRGGGAGAKIDAADRARALLSLAQRRSRILISSGNNEPVEDQGGQGHSVFARALLTGLEDMAPDAFSARELFDGYILPLVAANASQEPQYRPIERTGHEGGDVVFVRQHGG